MIGVGFYVVAKGDGDLGRITTFESPDDKGLFLAVTAATSIAFFAMVGFEDSVNMVEETKEPERIFPRTMLTGLGIAVIIYMLVAVSVVSVLTSDQIANAADGRALLEVVRVGSPDFPIDKVFPFLAVFAVANTALINMLMASRLLYGLANQDVLPRSLGKVSPRTRAPYMGILFSTVLALGLIVYVANRAEDDIVVNLASVTALLLLGVFTVVNVACLVLRRDGRDSMFRSPGLTPAVAAVACLFLIGPWVDRDAIIYEIAGGDAGDRRRALGDHLADEPRDPLEEHRIPRHRAHGRVAGLDGLDHRGRVRLSGDTDPRPREPARPGARPAAGVPGSGGGRRRRGAAAHDAAAGVRR